MMRLEDRLRELAGSRGGACAVDDGQTALSYEDLYRRSTIDAGKMTKGRTIVLRDTRRADFLVSYLAAHLAGSVAVPVEEDVKAESLEAMKEKLSAQVFPDDIADVLFTSGTTGQSKGVMLSHQAIMANAENLITAQGYHPGLSFIICGPLSHLGSLSKCWATLASGGTLRLTRGMKNMNAFFQAMEQAEGSTATFLVPASIRMLLRFGSKQLGALANKIEFIETGAAPMTEADMAELRRLLPGARLFNTYASTETGIVCTYDYARNPIVGGCLGRPMPHSRVSISAEGLVETSGMTSMSGYAGDEKLTRETLRDGTILTHDRGFLRDGMLCLQGRDDDIINAGGYKINPVEVEEAAMKSPRVADCICVPALHPVLGTVAKLVVVSTGNGKLDVKALAKELSGRLDHYKLPALYEQAARIARTFNGKPDRKAYRL